MNAHLCSKAPPDGSDGAFQSLYSVCVAADGGRDRLGLVRCVEPVVADQPARAFRRTLAAGYALCVVDAGQVIHHVYGVVLAGSLTDFAADAADVAVYAQGRALSTEEQATVTSASKGTLTMMCLGQAAAQFMQPTHFSLSTRAMPSEVHGNQRGRP
jgi:hypothetical protein